MAKKKPDSQPEPVHISAASQPDGTPGVNRPDGQQPDPSSPESIGSEELEINIRPPRPVKTNLKPPAAWIRGPAVMDAVTTVDRLLTDNALERGIHTVEVARIRCGRRKGDSLIYFYATTESDPDGLEVKRERSSIVVNLVSFLAPRGLNVPTGERRRFDVLVAGPDSPFGPALVFDLFKPVEIKAQRIRKKNSDPKPNDSSTAM